MQCGTCGHEFGQGYIANELMLLHTAWSGPGSELDPHKHRDAYEYLIDFKRACKEWDAHRA